MCGLISLANFDRLLDRLARLARQAEDEGAVDRDAELVAVLGEAARDVGAQAFLDVVQDLVVAGFVADQQQAQAVVVHDLQGLVRHIGLGVAATRSRRACPAARDLLDARLGVGEGVVVEHDLLHLGHVLLDPLHLGENVLRRAHAVAVTADGLRPQAERASASGSRGRCRCDT